MFTQGSGGAAKCRTGDPYPLLIYRVYTSFLILQLSCTCFPAVMLACYDQHAARHTVGELDHINIVSRGLLGCESLVVSIGAGSKGTQQLKGRNSSNWIGLCIIEKAHMVPVSTSLSSTAIRYENAEETSHGVNALYNIEVLKP